MIELTLPLVIVACAVAVVGEVGSVLSLAVVYVYDTPLGNVLRNFSARGMDKMSTAAHLSWAVFMLCQKICYS